MNEKENINEILNLNKNTVRSMTTYAKKEIANEYLQATFELKSLNSRFCDVNIRIPRWMGSYEEKIRKILYGEMKRGKIDFLITVENYSEIIPEIIPDINLAKSYLIAIKKISESINLPFNMGITEFLSICKDVIISRKNNIKDEIIWNLVETTLIELIREGQKYSIIEGDNIKKDIEFRIENINSSVNKIIENKDKINNNIKSHIKDKISQLIKDFQLKDDISEERLLQEIAIYIDRTDITEEIVRIKSHIKQFLNTLNGFETEKGKRMDFLTQELFREFNTIGNKVLNDEISHIIVDVKVELEKIREQIQNVL